MNSGLNLYGSGGRKMSEEIELYEQPEEQLIPYGSTSFIAATMDNQEYYGKIMLFFFTNTYMHE